MNCQDVPSPEDRNFFCWLIEYSGPGDTTPAYVSGPSCGHPWTICFDPWKAVRFPDKETAEKEMKILNLRKPWHVTEHGFTR